jgi:hypothetical protein
VDELLMSRVKQLKEIEEQFERLEVLISEKSSLVPLYVRDFKIMLAEAVCKAEAEYAAF